MKDTEKRKSLAVPQVKSFFSDFKLQAILLLIIGLVFYGNTINNEYALDDGIVILKNEYVQKGFKGLSKIFKTDTYDSYYKQMNAKQQLTGGRYRPLSVATFAIEQQFFGGDDKENPPSGITAIRHAINVLLYILSVIFLLFFLNRFILQKYPIAAFLTCFIFLIHPIHTEVVANVKSRDEILSFLFIVLAFISALKYKQAKKIKMLFIGLLFCFLALLSKEYAITLLILIPFLFYVYLKESFKGAILSSVPYFVVVFIYILIRYSVVGAGSTSPSTDVLNNPYLFASSAETWATKIDLLNNYLKLQFVPYPLSSDYSYNTFPYTNFSNPLVWVSILLTICMVILTIYLFFKRNIISFALAFYLLNLFLISNLVFDIGATMGERLVYHSSFGFSLTMAVFIDFLIRKYAREEKYQLLTILFVVIISIPAFFIVIERNADWKNDTTLFIADAETVPNSALVNGNAGKAYVDLAEKPENKSQEQELLKKAELHLKRSVEIHNKYVNGYINLGVVAFKRKEYEKTRKYWDIAKQIFPNNPLLKRNYSVLATTYYNDAMTIGAKNPKQAIEWLEQAVELDSLNVEYWYNLGGACFTANEFDKAKNAWEKTLKLNPNHQQAMQGMNALPQSK
ncbi:MAG: tetratricopeptide repeat protein [Bacteroidia bacterium]|nr:tetratricopeptide repeat protein [Bacteroidia bacterium]